MPPKPSPFHVTLRQLREQSTMTVEELAKRVGVNRSTIHRLEAGDQRPTWDLVQKLATALNVATDVFRDSA